MQLFRSSVAAILAVLASCGVCAARGIIINTWANAPGTYAATAVALDSTSVAPNPQLVDSVSFAPGATATSTYSLQLLGGSAGYCWGTATAGDGCDGANAVQVALQPITTNGLGQATDFIVYFGYAQPACSGATATLTVDHHTYDAANPCALSNAASGSLGIGSPLDTGALEFTNGVLDNPSNYLGHGWTEVPYAPVPAPASAWLMLCGLGLFAGRAARRKRAGT